MQQVRLENLMKMKALELARQEVDMLPSFIRMADYMIVESLLVLVMTSTDEFLQLLLKPPKKTGLYTLIVGLSKDNIEFSPREEEVTGMMIQLMDSMVSTVHTVPRILYLASFSAYLRDKQIVGPHLADMIRSSDTFNRIRNGIEGVVKNDFQKAREDSESFKSTPAA
jgi:hypothetical protein